MRPWVDSTELLCRSGGSFFSLGIFFQATRVGTDEAANHSPDEPDCIAHPTINDDELERLHQEEAEAFDRYAFQLGQT